MSDADRRTRAIEAMVARLDGVGMVDVDEDPKLAEGVARHLLTCGGCDRLIEPGHMVCDECLQEFGMLKTLHALRGRQFGGAIMREIKEIERGEAPAHDEPFGGQPELARMLIEQLDSV